MNVDTLYRVLRQLTTILVLEQHILESLEGMSKHDPDFSYMLIRRQEQIIELIRGLLRRYDQFLKPLR